MSQHDEEYEQRIRQLYASARTTQLRVHPLSEEDLRTFLGKGEWRRAHIEVGEPGHFSALWNTPGAGRVWLRFLGGGWVNYDLSYNGRVRDRGQAQMYKILKIVRESELEREILAEEESAQ